MAFLNATTPEELRRAVAESADPIHALDFVLDLQASAEARAFCTRDGADNGWLLALGDAFIDHTMAEATSGTGLRHSDLARRHEGPDPGRAIVVRASDYDIEQTVVEASQNTAASWRRWLYISEIENGAWRNTGVGPCDRCDLPPQLRLDHHEAGRIAGVFHVSRGRYVVEFALCATCLDFYTNLNVAASQECS
ncbi:hypothetical protein [Agromyces seonyuensis]|uniref:Uncharacterized protein n=1 Tax=Agromyces seonyuensis TaxID=2662446 RepID=A0A6I4NV20_9MICO|nr:hypothetical protein [Agromyces seonyuensis]MWB98306.1 hypothetical protein [Agromyces seonyuensis]